MTESSAEDRQQRGEALLREAHLFRMRQEPAAAEEACRRALEYLPKDAGVREMLGDLVREQAGDIDEVRRWYEEGLELSPGSESLELKIAHLVLTQGEEVYAREQAQLLMEGGGPSATTRKRQILLATLMSLAVSGLGQIYNEERIKGGILITIWLLSIWQGYPEVFRLLAVFMDPNRAGAAAFNSFGVVLGLVGLLAHMYAIMDAASKADRLNRQAGGGE